ncbi:MAG: cytochrome C oxidase subunit IV family protein [Chthoniobacterales bacterium]|nr:cytochrome C oxidase subunit IV family protein [Chthoniobacterales bacterium]
MNETQQPTATEVIADGHVKAGHAQEEPMHDDHSHVAAHVNKYLMVGGLLLLFTGLTVFLSYVDFGTHKMNMAVGMVVATIKAGLVAMIFMHLNAERQLIYRILVFTVFFVLALFFLTYLHWYDPISR